ncbi:MAG: glycosyltransferase [Firmicutes bacterium]|nr:glycosyltransferase [Bacillota bacterium]
MKKRLLLVTHGFPFGESERSFMTEEVRQLSASFDLMILAPKDENEIRYPTEGIWRIEQYGVLSFRRCGSVRAVLSLLQPDVLRELWQFGRQRHFVQFFQGAKEILYFRYQAWNLEEKISVFLQSEQIHILYTYWSTAEALAAVNLKKRFPGLKVVTRFHGMDLYEERTSIHWQPFREQIAEGADGLCFACSFGRSYFQQRWGTGREDKLHLCYLGSTDRGELRPSESQSLRMISCSNLIPLKRVELIIKGLALLPKTMEVSWTIFGEGPEREKLEKLAAEEFQSCPNISWKFRGFVPNDVLTEEYRRLSPDLFITTSSTEGGAPVSIQEVFSMGIPAIGTPVGGIPDLILDGKTGFLLPEQTEADHVAQAVTRFEALTAGQKQQMRQSVRLHWAKNFNAEKNARHFAAYFEQL